MATTTLTIANTGVLNNSNTLTGALTPTKTTIIEANGDSDQMLHHIEIGGRDRVYGEPTDKSQVLSYYKGLVGIKNLNPNNIGEGHLEFNIDQILNNPTTSVNALSGQANLIEYGIPNMMAEVINIPAIINLSVIDNAGNSTPLTDVYLRKGKDYVAAVSPNGTVTLNLTDSGLASLKTYLNTYVKFDYQEGLLFEAELDVSYKGNGNSDDVADDVFTTSFIVTKKDISMYSDALNSGKISDAGVVSTDAGNIYNKLSSGLVLGSNTNGTTNVQQIAPVKILPSDFIEVNPSIYDNDLERGFYDRLNTDNNDHTIVKEYFKGLIGELDPNKPADMGKGWLTFNAKAAYKYISVNPSLNGEVMMLKFTNLKGDIFIDLMTKSKISVSHVDSQGIVTPAPDHLEINKDYKIIVNADGTADVFFTEEGLLKMIDIMGKPPLTTDVAATNFGSDIIFTMELDGVLDDGSPKEMVDDAFSVSFRATLDPKKLGGLTDDDFNTPNPPTPTDNLAIPSMQDGSNPDWLNVNMVEIKESEFVAGQPVVLGALKISDADGLNLSLSEILDINIGYTGDNSIALTPDDLIIDTIDTNNGKQDGLKLSLTANAVNKLLNNPKFDKNALEQITIKLKVVDVNGHEAMHDFTFKIIGEGDPVVTPTDTATEFYMSEMGGSWELNKDLVEIHEKELPNPANMSDTDLFIVGAFKGLDVDLLDASDFGIEVNGNVMDLNIDDITFTNINTGNGNSANLPAIEDGWELGFKKSAIEKIKAAGIFNQGDTLEFKFKFVVNDFNLGQDHISEKEFIMKIYGNNDNDNSTTTNILLNNSVINNGNTVPPVSNDPGTTSDMTDPSQGGGNDDSVISAPDPVDDKTNTVTDDSKTDDTLVGTPSDDDKVVTDDNTPVTDDSNNGGNTVSDNVVAPDPVVPVTPVTPPVVVTPPVLVSDPAPVTPVAPVVPPVTSGGTSPVTPPVKPTLPSMAQFNTSIDAIKAKIAAVKSQITKAPVNNTTDDNNGNSGTATNNTNNTTNDNVVVNNPVKDPIAPVTPVVTDATKKALSNLDSYTKTMDSLMDNMQKIMLSLKALGVDTKGLQAAYDNIHSQLGNKVTDTLAKLSLLDDSDDAKIVDDYTDLKLALVSDNDSGHHYDIYMDDMLVATSNTPVTLLTDADTFAF